MDDGGDRVVGVVENDELSGSGSQGVQGSVFGYGDEEDVDVGDDLGDVEDDAGLEDETVDHDEVGDEDSKVHVPEECVEYVASLQADGAHWESAGQNEVEEGIPLDGPVVVQVVELDGGQDDNLWARVVVEQYEVRLKVADVHLEA